MNKSEHLNLLGEALTKAQAVIEGALKDSANPFFKCTYADLSSVWDACRKPLTDNGLSVTQMPIDTGASGIGIETMLIHSSGQWLSNTFTMPVSKADAQGVGSAITYARRYALAAMVGVAPEDDDGNAATKAAPKKVKEEETPDQQRARSMATRMKELWADDKEAAYNLLYNDSIDNEMKLLVWGYLSDKSAMRREIKTMSEARRIA